MNLSDLQYIKTDKAFKALGDQCLKESGAESYHVGLRGSPSLRIGFEGGVSLKGVIHTDEDNLPLVDITYGFGPARHSMTTTEAIRVKDSLDLAIIFNETLFSDLMTAIANDVYLDEARVVDNNRSKAYNIAQILAWDLIGPLNLTHLMALKTHLRNVIYTFALYGGFETENDPTYDPAIMRALKHQGYINYEEFKGLAGLTKPIIDEFKKRLESVK